MSYQSQGAFILGTDRERVRKVIEEEFKLYGVHPMCRNCLNDCKQYDAPGLKFECHIRRVIK